MTIDPYTEEVRRLFAETAHAGTLDEAVRCCVADQGVRIELFARVGDGVITTLRFRAFGCPHVIAAAEAFCAGYENRPVGDLERVKAAEFMQSLAVPVEKTGRILVLEDAVQALRETLGKHIQAKE